MRVVKRICNNVKVHVNPYVVDDDKKPEDDKCPLCGKYLDQLRCEV